MPTLAPPPPIIDSGPRLTRLPSAALSSEIELPAVSFFGRSLAEYAQFFALDLAALRGRDVLDVAAGPSSFVAEACARKIAAVAVDPLYDSAPAELARHVERDYQRMFEQMRAKPRLLRFKSFPSIDAAELDRRAAAQRFLSDYASRALHGRYVAGALPRLPFFDGTFDLVLCAHLLFSYAKLFDFEWHLAACRELVRVTAGEVRLHPIVGADGKLFPALARLRRELRAEGITSELVDVDYEFFVGTRSMLVLRRTAP